MLRSLFAVVVVVTVAVPSIASSAPSRAWTAARKAHADAPIIAGMDVASAKSSESFKKFYPLLLAKKPDVKDVLDSLQTHCSFDPFTAIRSVVAVVDDTNNDRGAFYLALARGWNAAKLGACVKKVGKAEKQKDIVVGPVKKGIQQFSVKGGGDTLYVGWIGRDVLVVATDPSDKALLQSMLGGNKGGEANRLANKLDTGATLWMVVIKSQPIQANVEMKAFSATIKVARGNMDADMRVVTGDTAQATELVTMFNRELPNVQSSLPPAAKALVKTLELTSAGAEVKATASAPEADVLALLGMFL